MKHIRMPKKIADAWLAALRSGEYEQATGTLKRNGAYCCLGVLQMVCDGETQRLTAPSYSWLRKHDIEFITSDDDDSTAHGSSCNPPIMEAKASAAELNDDGVPFTKIADLIETELEYTDEP